MPTAAGRQQAPHSSYFSAPLAESDPELAGMVDRELRRQQDEIELIASENMVSRAVLEAAGSVLTNKYAEGYPGNRYYGGCQFFDQAETLAIERAKKLFKCRFANVQPHSGSTANQEAFMALMRPGDTFMGLDLAAGGHLTHGSPVNLSGKWFKVVPYSVRRQDHRIDMDALAALARQPEFRAYARAVVENAKALGEVLSTAGYDLVAGGTDTHLLLVDLRPKKLTGNVAEKSLGRAHITTNKNGVPFDPEKPQVTSGIRIGSPAGTTRGFGIAEFQHIGRLMAEVLDGLAQNGEAGNAKIETKVKAEAIALTRRFPIYA